VELACGPWLATDVSTLLVVHRYHEPKCNVSFHNFETLENGFAQRRNRSDSLVLLCHVRPYFDDFKVSWDDSEVNSDHHSTRFTAKSKV
jgi:hypothetical protein